MSMSGSTDAVANFQLVQRKEFEELVISDTYKL